MKYQLPLLHFTQPTIVPSTLKSTLRAKLLSSVAGSIFALASFAGAAVVGATFSATAMGAMGAMGVVGNSDVAAEAKADAIAPKKATHALWTGVFDAYFQRYAKQYFGPFFDWQWFKAQAIAESKLTVDAESWAGAQGIMQIMPATYVDIQERNPHFDTVHKPRWNIAAGVFYNQYLYSQLSEVPEPDRLLLTFAAYNAGLGTVYKAQRKVGKGNAASRTWAGIKPYMPKETQGYVDRIVLLREHWVMHPGDIPQALADYKAAQSKLAKVYDTTLPEMGQVETKPLDSDNASANIEQQPTVSEPKVSAPKAVTNAVATSKATSKAVSKVTNTAASLTISSATTAVATPAKKTAALVGAPTERQASQQLAFNQAAANTAADDDTNKPAKESANIRVERDQKKNRAKVNGFSAF